MAWEEEGQQMWAALAAIAPLKSASSLRQGVSPKTQSLGDKKRSCHPLTIKRHALKGLDTICEKNSDMLLNHQAVGIPAGGPVSPPDINPLCRPIFCCRKP
jgi:hypothetical protein